MICALMKEKSPSCGTSRIYDGSFTGRLTEGQGLASEFLRRAGIRVFSEEELDAVQRIIDSEDGMDR